jgi:hypothetical protein
MKKVPIVLCIFAFMLVPSILGWSDDTEDLVEAIKAGDVAAVKNLIARGVELNQHDSNFCTPLWWAVDGGNVDIARLLLEAGADVNSGQFNPLPGGREVRPIERALSKNNDELVDLLLENGVKRYEVDRYYDGALDVALRGGKLDYAETLVSEGKAGLGGGLRTLQIYERGSAEIREFIRKHGPKGISTGALNLLDLLFAGNTEFDEYHLLPSHLATTFLHDSKNAFRYAPDKAFDDDLSTSWVEGVEGDGIGQKLAFIIEEDTKWISIVPGYGVEKYHKTNNRLKKATLTLYKYVVHVAQIDSKTYYEKLTSEELDFEDALTYQKLPLAIPSLPDDPRGATKIYGVLEIGEVYPGTKWDDTCIAEIRLH